MFYGLLIRKIFLYTNPTGKKNQNKYCMCCGGHALYGSEMISVDRVCWDWEIKIGVEF